MKTNDNLLINENIDDIISEFEKNKSNDNDIDLFDYNKDISEEELKNYINTNKSSEFNNLDENDIKELLIVANKRINDKKFSVYISLPESVKKMVDRFSVAALSENKNKSIASVNNIKNTVAEMLIDEFIDNINYKRMQNDFNTELKSLFSEAGKELSDSIVEYTVNRNDKYEELINNIDDPDKKEKLKKILDRINDAYTIDELKEFCKKCKIKKFDIEKAYRYYKDFNIKYDNSPYKIPDISKCPNIILKKLDKYDIYVANALMIAFCKYCINMTPSNVLDHTFMYYFIYNIHVADINTGDKKEISDKFMENISECIENLISRNSSVLKIK